MMSSEAEDMAGQAERWYVRLQEPDCTDQEREDCARWRARSPSNEAAFREVADLWRRSQALAHDPAMADIMREARRVASPGANVRFRFWLPGLAALVAILALAGGILAPSLWTAPEVPGVRYETALGERREVRLPDGTIVVLDTRSALMVRYSDGKRLVELETGQAQFAVEHDPGRPFTVEAGGGSVTAVGTRFQVRTDAKGASVTLMEGVVVVEPPSEGAQHAADVRAFSLDRNGGAIRYSIGPSREDVMAAEQAEYDRGIRIDARVPVGQGLSRSGNVEGRLATQRFEADWFDRIPLLGDVPSRWKIIDLTTRRKRDLGPSEAAPAPSAAADVAQGSEPPWRFAQDPLSNRVALLTRVGAGEGLIRKPYVRLSMRADSRAGRSVVCAAALCTKRAISDAQWRPGSDEVLFTVTEVEEGMAQSLFRWNVRTGDVQPVVQSMGLLSGGRDPYDPCGVSFAALICVAAEAGHPPRLERIDLATGERRILFDPNAALSADLAQGAPVRLLRWTDATGERFSGQFFVAQKAGDALPPLFVTYYNCEGFLRGGTGDEWPLATMAAQGIAALCINRPTKRSLDAVERYDQGRLAVEGAVALLGAMGEIDPLKVGMGGLSFGSEVTMWTVVHSDLLTAASISSPLLSPTYYLTGSLKGEPFLSGLYELWQVRGPDESRERWHVLSPAFNIDKIRSPVLMQMPEQEYFYALDYAIPLIRAQRADLYVFAHEPHQKFQPRHKLAVYERNLDWFLFWLRSVESPDLAKAAQYAHWRSMRNTLTTQDAAPDGSPAD